MISMEKTVIKIAEPGELIFKDFALTELTDYSKMKKFRGMGMHLIFQKFLNDYGIYQSMKTWLGNENNEDFNKNEVLAVSIKIGEFPIENELILRQMYGWTNASVHIGLYSEHTQSDFIYNLNDYTCVFDGKKFESLEKLLNSVKEVSFDRTETNYTLKV